MAGKKSKSKSKEKENTWDFWTEADEYMNNPGKYKKDVTKLYQAYDDLNENSPNWYEGIDPKFAASRRYIGETEGYKTWKNNQLSEGERQGLHTMGDNDLLYGYNLLRNNKPASGSESNSYLTRIEAYKNEIEKRGLSLDSDVQMPVRKTIPGTAVTDKPDIASLVAKAKEGKASQEDLEIMGKAEKDNPGILAENGAGRITIQAAEDAINGKEVPPAEKNAKNTNPQTADNADNADNTGMDNIQSQVDALKEKGASFSKYGRENIGGFRSLINDVMDVAGSINDLNEAKKGNEVRSAALEGRKGVKEKQKQIKTYLHQLDKLQDEVDHAETKQQKILAKAALKAKEQELKDLESQITQTQNDFKNTYSMSIDDASAGMGLNDTVLDELGIDADQFLNIAGDKAAELSDLFTKRDELNKELDYMTKDMKADVETYLKTPDTPEGQQALENLVKIYDDGKFTNLLKSKIEIGKGTIDTLGPAVEQLNDPEISELYANVKGTADAFLENKIEPTEENLEILGKYEKEFNDIIKSEDKYDPNIQEAKVATISAISRLLFNIFDDIKTGIVFAAAIDNGNPALVQTALDRYNDRLQMAESARKTDQYGAYTQNRIRDITADNIARFNKITEIDPEIAKLEKILNIQEGEAGRRQMDALESGFEEFNKYKQEHPGEATDFAAWVSAYKNEGGVVGQIISTLLMNFPGLKKAIEKNINKAANSTSDSNSNAIGDYASGGIVPGNSYSGDNLTANVNSGEMILNQEQQANLWNLINSKDSNNKKTASFLDNAYNKVKPKQEKPEEPDIPLIMDKQGTVQQALASRTNPQQRPTMQGQSLNVNKGFGKTLA